MYLALILIGLYFQHSNWNVNEYGVALYGYDPVSYFQKNPQPGQAELTCQYDDAIFYFSSTENLEKFMSDPEHYLPQYGGYCAYTMGATGEKNDIHPGTYKITDGRLLLFSNKDGINHLNAWNADEAKLLKKANKNWKKIARPKN